MSWSFDVLPIDVILIIITITLFALTALQNIEAVLQFTEDWYTRGNLVIDEIIGEKTKQTK